MIVGIILAFLAVLAAIMVEAYKSKMRRANPYNTKSTTPEPAMLSAPAEHSRNDRNRKGDVALTQTIAQLTAASLKPWSWTAPHEVEHLVAVRKMEKPSQAEVWAEQLTTLGTDISSAMLLPATVSTGNPSLGTHAYVVDFGRAHITCETDEEMEDLQRALTFSAMSIVRRYLLDRAEELAVRATRAEVTDMPVWTILRVNGSSTMSFRSEEEAIAVVGALNDVYYERTELIRNRLAQTVADLARKAKDWA